MTVCAKCHRPLKAPTPTGLGPICAKRAAAIPVPAHDRDLFGYDIDLAVHAARYRLQVQIEAMAAEAYIAVRDGFRAARVRLLGWGARP